MVLSGLLILKIALLIQKMLKVTVLTILIMLNSVKKEKVILTKQLNMSQSIIKIIMVNVY